MQDIITAKEQVQHFERMQALQLWLIAEVNRATRIERHVQADDSLKTHPKAMPTSVKQGGQLIIRVAGGERSLTCAY